MKFLLRKKSVSILASFALTISAIAQSESGCTALNTNGDFESVNCASNADGSIPYAFNNGCVPGWFSANGSPDIRESIINQFNPTLSIPNVNGNNFATLFTSNNGQCRNEVIVIEKEFDPSKTYRLSFSHRTGTFSSIGSIPLLNLDIQLTSGLSNVISSSTSPCNNLTLASGSESIFSQANFSSLTWISESDITFKVQPGQNQIAFIPEGNSGNLGSTAWAIDDIVIEECDDCSVSFEQVGNNFINTSVPSDIALQDDCCPLGFSSVTWTVTEYFNTGGSSGNGWGWFDTYTVNSYNLNYVPSTSPYLVSYKICLEVIDCNECSGEVCTGWQSFGESKESFKSNDPTMDGGDINVFPNPNKGSFQVMIDEFEESDNPEMFIADLSGKRLLSIDNPSRNVSIEATELSTGMYVLVFKTDKMTRTAKILIQK